MTRDEFYKKLRESTRPVIVDFWAPWCVPCRVIGPALEKLGRDYAFRVDLWKVNADQEPDLLREMQVYGIPTLIAFHGDHAVARQTGASSAGDLALLFESALSGEAPERGGPAAVDRRLRSGAGLALIGLAILGGAPGMRLFVAGTGALVAFSAFYDRCPVYRMISVRIRKFLWGNVRGPSGQ